jgi:hypothetical protein
VGVTVEFTTTIAEFAKGLRTLMLRTGIIRAVAFIGFMCTIGGMLAIATKGPGRDSFGLVFGALSVYIVWWSPIASSKKAWRESPGHAGPHRWAFTPLSIIVQSPSSPQQTIPWTEVTEAYVANGFLFFARPSGLNMFVPVRAIGATDRHALGAMIQEALGRTADVRALVERAA